jgi:hypothetical protein
MNPRFPFGWDDGGRTATVSGGPWVRGLIEQLLLTAPGERVMRPEFGSGALQLVFAPNGPELAAAVQLLVEGSVRRYLAGLVELEGLSVTAEDAVLRIALRYRLVATGAEASEDILLPAGGVA